MLHFSCDACGLPLSDERFTVTVDVRAEHDPDALTEADLDADHMADLADYLEGVVGEGDGPAPFAPPARREGFRYDLCPVCVDRYRRDPLGREALRRLNFSQN